MDQQDNEPGAAQVSDKHRVVTFPDSFLWGVATASYQIEGAVDLDGRGRSIWDTFCETPGAVLNGDNGEIACDHYRRMSEDVALMQTLHMNGYRFSVAWPRVQPTGSGPINSAGLDFYDRLVDELLAASIEPFPTLYHWDLPQPLEDAGGWPVRDTAERFAEYAMVVHDRLADRVSHWTTLNEPWCSAFLGYASGHHAPGRTDPAASFRAAHHLMLGHGLAVQAMRETRPELSYGVTVNLYPVDAATMSTEDLDARRQADGLTNRIFLDPLLRGSYPGDVLADLGALVEPGVIRDGDLSIISAPIDFMGVNYYSRHTVRRAAANGAAPEPNDLGPDPAWIGAEGVIRVATGRPVTAMGWEVDPGGLTETLTRLGEEYDAPPLYVTENGAAYIDSMDSDGSIHDDQRRAYLEAHFCAAAAAIDAGVDLRGYFVWTLLDNFEWAWGYDRRFGIVRVSPDDLDRRVKDSGWWYRSVASSNRVTIVDDDSAGVDLN